MISAPARGPVQVCALIGDPVAHSVSPAMHNAAFRAVGLDWVYVPLRVEAAHLREAVSGLKALNFAGFNVTIPHKVSVIPHLDDLDTLAENLGAVNTVVNQDGYLKGHNTDASGFLRALEGEGFSPAKKKVVMLGAGGAARAASFVLADKGASLTILNRHPRGAEDLSARLSGTFRRDIRAFELTSGNLRESLVGADLLVNTTSLGMAPELDFSPVPRYLLKKKLVVFDIIYNPLRTRLMREAAEKGAKVIGGLEMLVQQGAVAFELWTGRPAPVDIMRSAAQGALNAR